MGRYYSLDLRVRVAGFVEAGHSRRAAARHFGVSDSFAIKLLRRQAPSGSPAPAQQGRPRGTGRLAPYETVLVRTVEAKPDITMPELAARLWQEHGIRAAPATLSRLLCPVCSAGKASRIKSMDRPCGARGCFRLGERRFASIYPASLWSTCSGPPWKS